MATVANFAAVRSARRWALRGARGADGGHSMADELAKRAEATRAECVTGSALEVS